MRRGVAGMAESQVHVTQAHKGVLSGVKAEQDPYAAPLHHCQPTSDEDPLSTPYSSPGDSMQLEDDLSSPGRPRVKPEHGECVAACAFCNGTSKCCKGSA